MFKRMILLLTVAAMLAVLLVVTAGPALANGPTTKEACKGAKQQIKDDDPTFYPYRNNQGQCIQFVKQF